MIHTEIGIGAPAARVWDTLIATDQWAEWNPFAKVSGRFSVGERVAVTKAVDAIELEKFKATSHKLRLTCVRVGEELALRSFAIAD